MTNILKAPFNFALITSRTNVPTWTYSYVKNGTFLILLGEKPLKRDGESISAMAAAACQVIPVALITLSIDARRLHDNLYERFYREIEKTGGIIGYELLSLSTMENYLSYTV